MKIEKETIFVIVNSILTIQAMCCVFYYVIQNFINIPKMSDWVPVISLSVFFLYVFMIVILYIFIGGLEE